MIDPLLPALFGSAEVLFLGIGKHGLRNLIPLVFLAFAAE